MLETIRSNPDPARIDLIAFSPEAAQSLLPGGTNFESGKEKGTAAFLCHGPTCLAPVFNAEDLAGLLRPKTG